MKLMIRTQRSALLVFMGLLSAAVVLLPQASWVTAWSGDPTQNTSICTAIGSQYPTTSVSDGSGGAIIAWHDSRSVYSDVYAQRVDAAGNAMWGTDGLAVCTATGAQISPKSVSDGSGGAIVAWTDSRDYSSTSRDIYVQRVDEAGNVKWKTDGVAICTAAFDQKIPIIVSDGSGGAIISWTDLRNSASTGIDIYAQRVDAAGNVMWGTNGVGVCTTAGDQQWATTESDGSGGAIISWVDNRNAIGTGDDIYTQRVDAAGTVKWSGGGVAICTVTGDQQWPTSESDGSGGAIVIWQDSRNFATTDVDIYAQRVNAAGQVTGAANGTAICTATGGQGAFLSASDGSGGAIVAWVDGRNVSTTGLDIYARRVNFLGNPLWASDGVAVCAAVSSQDELALVGDGFGGAIVSWVDSRNAATTGSDIYGQRVGGAGTLLWPVDGVAISTATADQPGTVMVSDGGNGAIVAWGDPRNESTTDYDIYAQRVNASGALRSPPNTPANVFPVDGAVVPTAADVQLQSSAFSDSDGDTHAASHWQITTKSGDYSAPSLIHDSMQTTGDKSVHSVPQGVVDLADATKYYWRVRYKDSYGELSGWSAQTSFATTSPTAPSVTTDNASSITANSARLNGNLTSLGTASSVTVSFVWGTAAGGPYPNETTGQTVTATGVFYCDLGSLTSGTPFYYEAKAVGNGTTFGAEKTFTTTTSTAPPSVTTDNATSVTTNSARLNGSLTSLGTASSVTVSFVWGTTAGGPYPNETAGQTMTAMGAFYYDLGSLTSGTAYYYKAKAVGNGTSYGTEHGFTAGTAPGTGTLTVTPDERTVTAHQESVQLTGTVASKDKDIAHLYYRVDGASNWVEVSFTDDDGNAKTVSYSFSTFIPRGKQHTVEIKATDAGGNDIGTEFGRIDVTVSSGSKAWVVVVVSVAAVAIAAVAGYFVWRYRGKIKGKATKKVEEAKQKLGE